MKITDVFEIENLIQKTKKGKRFDYKNLQGTKNIVFLKVNGKNLFSYERYDFSRSHFAKITLIKDLDSNCYRNLNIEADALEVGTYFRICSGENKIKISTPLKYFNFKINFDVLVKLKNFNPPSQGSINDFIYSSFNRLGSGHLFDDGLFFYKLKIAKLADYLSIEKIIIKNDDIQKTLSHNDGSLENWILNTVDFF